MPASAQSAEQRLRLQSCRHWHTTFASPPCICRDPFGGFSKQAHLCTGCQVVLFCQWRDQRAQQHSTVVDSKKAALPLGQQMHQVRLRPNQLQHLGLQAAISETANKGGKLHNDAPCFNTLLSDDASASQPFILKSCTSLAVLQPDSNQLYHPACYAYPSHAGIPFTSVSCTLSFSTTGSSCSGSCRRCAFPKNTQLPPSYAVPRLSSTRSFTQ